MRTQAQISLLMGVGHDQRSMSTAQVGKVTIGGVPYEGEV